MAKTTITYTITFTGGAGTIVFSDVDGLDDDKTIICDPADPVSPQSFKADQSGGFQDATVSGTAPDGGSIVVSVKNGEKELANKKFTGLFKQQDITYNV
jgi:hypothetical protein